MVFIKAWRAMCALALCTGLMCQVAAGQNFVKVVQDSEILSGEAFCDSLLTRVEFPHAVSRLSNYPNRFGIFCRIKKPSIVTVVDTVYIRDTIYIKEYVREEPRVVSREPVKVEKTTPKKKVVAEKKAPAGNPWQIGIKTNLLSDVLVIPAIAVEMKVMNHISFNLEAWYTPLNIFAPEKDTNYSGFRPQFRYWFGKNSLMRQGNYVAIDGALMWYTLKWRDGHLYQNGKEGMYDKKSTNSAPAWSAGVTYGYCLGLGKKKNLGLEFELGIGYQRYTQNIGKYNEQTLVWELYDYQERQHFGVTHANVNLTYRFSVNKKR